MFLENKLKFIFVKSGITLLDDELSILEVTWNISELWQPLLSKTCFNLKGYSVSIFLISYKL